MILEKKLTELAREYEANVNALKRIIIKYKIPYGGLNKILQARENITFGGCTEYSSHFSKHYPAGLRLTLHALCEAYVELDRDPERFEDFLSKFDEHIPTIAEKVGKPPMGEVCRPKYSHIRPRALPDSLLRFALNKYLDYPEFFGEESIEKTEDDYSEESEV